MNVPREVYDDAERHALAAQACLSTAASVLDAENFPDDLVTARLMDRATQLAAHVADLGLEIAEAGRAGTLCEVITLQPVAQGLGRIAEPCEPVRFTNVRMLGRAQEQHMELLAHSVAHRQCYFDFRARHAPHRPWAVDTMGALMTLACEATLEIEA